MPELHPYYAGPSLATRTFMEVNPKPHITKALKKLAQKEGVTLNGFLVPFLNDIASGRLVRSPQYLPPTQQPGKAA